MLIISFGQAVLAKDIPVVIRSENVITTSSSKLQEGDKINFIVLQDVFVNSKLYLKSGTLVTGIITSIEDNDFLYKEASLYAENFITTDVNGQKIKLNGIVYKKGNDHWKLTQFIPFAMGILRGGEVQIKPCNSFTLFLESKNE